MSVAVLESKQTISGENKENEANTTSTSNTSLPSSLNSVKQVPWDPNVRHPLRNTWTLWYEYNLSNGKRPTTEQWGSNLKEIFAFSTVEDFWRLYNNVTPPSQLPMGCSYNLFKNGIEPKWEDAANAKGGKWTIIIQKSRGQLDRMWLWLLLACIGQVLEEEDDDICGVVVNVRKNQDKLCIWTRDAENKDGVVKIGQMLKKVLELPDVFPLGYQGHFKNPRQNSYEV